MIIFFVFAIIFRLTLQNSPITVAMLLQRTQLLQLTVLNHSSTKSPTPQRDAQCKSIIHPLQSIRFDIILYPLLVLTRPTPSLSLLLYPSTCLDLFVSFVQISEKRYLQSSQIMDELLLQVSSSCVSSTRLLLHPTKQLRMVRTTQMSFSLFNITSYLLRPFIYLCICLNPSYFRSSFLLTTIWFISCQLPRLTEEIWYWLRNCCRIWPMVSNLQVPNELDIHNINGIETRQ